MRILAEPATYFLSLCPVSPSKLFPKLGNMTPQCGAGYRYLKVLVSFLFSSFFVALEKSLPEAYLDVKRVLVYKPCSCATISSTYFRSIVIRNTVKK
jgi:hypothetical protein